MTPEARARLDRTSVACDGDWFLCPPIIDSATFADLRDALATIDAQAARVRELEEKLMAASYRVAVHRPRRPDTKTRSAG